MQPVTANDILKKHLIIKLEQNKMSSQDRADAILDAMEEYAQRYKNISERQLEVLFTQKEELTRLYNEVEQLKKKLSK